MLWVSIVPVPVCNRSILSCDTYYVEGYHVIAAGQMMASTLPLA